MPCGLCFEWDRYGAHNGKLIRPTVPEVRRAPGGQVVDAQGRILTGPGGVPILSPYHPRAIKTGNREPNPARTRYPDYTKADLARLSNPGRVFTKDNHRWLEQRAVLDMELLEKLGGTTVERMGTTRHPLFRVMPPCPENM